MQLISGTRLKWLLPFQYQSYQLRTFAHYVYFEPRKTRWWLELSSYSTQLGKSKINLWNFLFRVRFPIPRSPCQKSPVLLPINICNISVSCLEKLLVRNPRRFCTCLDCTAERHGQWSIGQWSSYHLMTLPLKMWGMEFAEAKTPQWRQSAC